MSQHAFGIIKIKQPATICRRLARIAKQHDATFIAADIPGVGWQGWFAARNLGAPFNDWRAEKVRADIDAAGLTARLWPV